MKAGVQQSKRINGTGLFAYQMVLFFMLQAIFSCQLRAESPGQPKQLFLKAQATFNQAQQLDGNKKRLTMLKAANQFEVLVKDFGIKNGYLLYNIGNAYYEAGEKGKAILYYRRAERLVPGYTDLKFNLNAAKQELKTLEPEKKWWSGIIKSVLFWHWMFDYSTRRIVTMGAFLLFWLFLIVLVFYKSSLLKAFTVVCAAITIATGGSYLVAAFKLNVETSGVIIKQQTQVRKGPGISYEPVYEQPLSEGTEFDLLEVQGEWWRVKLANSDDVWIKAAEVELI